MIWSNFLFRVGQWLKDNEQRVIKALIIIFVAIILIVLIIAGVEKWQGARYEKRVQALEKQFQEADQKAKDAQGRADVLKRAIDDKYAELQELAKRADAAESALRNAKTKVVTLEKTYETIRYTPMPDIPISVDDVCSDLAKLGYQCR